MNPLGEEGVVKEGTRSRNSDLVRSSSKSSFKRRYLSVSSFLSSISLRIRTSSEPPPACSNKDATSADTSAFFGGE